MPTLKSRRSGVDLRSIIGPLDQPARVLSHQDVARELIMGHMPRDPKPLVQKITKALQDAFDKGFCAAGGSVG